MANSGSQITILDVARVAGVSRQTVTRALNGLPDISAATRERVIGVARQLNYRPNRAAQGLVRGRDVTIGFVVDDLRNPFYPELASALSRIASEHGWSVILSDLGDDEQKARARLESLTHRVDALVLTGCRTNTVGLLPDDAVRGRALGIPIIMLDGSAADRVDAFVEIDYQAGVRAALDHLTANGRHRIAMIDSSHIASSRRHSYREYLHEHDLSWTEGSEFRDDETHQGGVRAATELIRGYPDADAVLVYNDVMAIGALKEFARSGVSVPDDIAVVGTDGLAIGALVTPELTSLSIDKAELAQHAVELVDNILSGRAPGGTRESRSSGLTLVVRESA
ncbi:MULTISPECIES: LacI family DNA-binding transcriptional regulator [unclassified Cryobacterium]|uniref:LacI family DNA-binding transcriptional regulator n=1 Tax=unclassified Cryobacterium TaxID=2649013 RepID=UPI002AB4D8AD|nr:MULTISPECIES: LacI family DNA-binding transcriptional regulator [unclassified Cryobacterium]MDY7543993.1 LacI family DNA-binding transcriptional regulator [Cryobacterium sp. 5B3]MEA9997724.1 LacI family DNA-binding transcriptional regulator [Cryobacterium sp. RTS3]MEB0265828.1 LacI family DNA-binding transcriptional regulator [Cryobacterium sp. 10I5]MEB0273180.1 LacI family DNA-binding transcriptional regulator [Cryobacterium sp. 5B3]